MKKDKTWAMNQVNNLDVVKVKGNFADFTTIPKDKAIRIISDMDEPEKPVELQELIEKYSKDSMSTYDVKVEREKFVNDLQKLLVRKQELPTIPKFIAETIEEDKERGYDVYDSIDLIIETNGGGLPSISDWVARNIDRYARAWLDGFTVEEEQLFYVVGKDNTAILSKGIDGNPYPREGVFSDYFVGHEDYMLTEKEIKDYDERYWAFRRSVEEVEE